MKIPLPKKLTKTRAGNVDGARKCIRLSVCMHMLTSVLSWWWEDSINITYMCYIEKKGVSYIIRNYECNNRVLFLTIKELSYLLEGNQKYKVNRRSTHAKAKHKKSNGHKNKNLTYNKMVDLKQNPDILFNYNERNTQII